MTARHACVERATAETDIRLELNLDGRGQFDCKTGIGFFDHMLHQVARHGLIDLAIKARGDLHIDGHHTVEDVGICLGAALGQALGNKQGIHRYGHAYVPLDEALSRVVLDLSGRPGLHCRVPFHTEKIGQFDTELVREFFNGVANGGALTLHLDTISGENSHHIAETLFKAFGRALRIAVTHDQRALDILPSTKGQL